MIIGWNLLRNKIEESSFFVKLLLEEIRNEKENILVDKNYFEKI